MPSFQVLRYINPEEKVLVRYRNRYGLFGMVENDRSVLYCETYLESRTCIYCIVIICRHVQ